MEHSTALGSTVCGFVAVPAVSHCPAQMFVQCARSVCVRVYLGVGNKMQYSTVSYACLCETVRVRAYQCTTRVRVCALYCTVGVCVYCTVLCCMSLRVCVRVCVCTVLYACVLMSVCVFVCLSVYCTVCASLCEHSSVQYINEHSQPCIA